MAGPEEEKGEWDDAPLLLLGPRIYDVHGLYDEWAIVCIRDDCDSFGWKVLV